MTTKIKQNTSRSYACNPGPKRYHHILPKQTHEADCSKSSVSAGLRPLSRFREAHDPGSGPNKPGEMSCIQVSPAPDEVHSWALIKHNHDEALPDHFAILPSSSDIMQGKVSANTMRTYFRTEMQAKTYRNKQLVDLPTRDATIPVTDDQRRYHVAVLTQAFRCVTLAGDNDSFVQTFKRTAHDGRLIEIVCWCILGELVKRTIFNEPLQNQYGTISRKPEKQYPTFAARFDACCKALALKKTICKELLDAPTLVKLVDDPLNRLKASMQNQKNNEHKRKLLSDSTSVDSRSEISEGQEMNAARNNKMKKRVRVDTDTNTPFHTVSYVATRLSDHLLPIDAGGVSSLSGSLSQSESVSAGGAEPAPSMIAADLIVSCEEPIDGAGDYNRLRLNGQTGFAVREAESACSDAQIVDRFSPVEGLEEIAEFLDLSRSHENAGSLDDFFNELSWD